MNDSARPWLAHLHAAIPGCSEYRTILDHAVRDTLVDASDLPLLRALAEVASLVLDADDLQRPLRPLFPGASRELGQFDPATLDLLKSVAADMPADLRARIRDVLWISRRGAELGGTRLMISDYCDAAEALAKGAVSSWDQPRSRFRRAASVAASMRWTEGLASARDRIRAFMRGAEWNAGVRVHAAELVAQWEKADAAEAAQIAEALAEAAVAAIGAEPASWDWPRYVLEVAADARRRSGDAADAQRLRLRRAELFLLHERWLEGREGVSPVTRASVLEWALTAYRDAGAPSEIVDPVHARLREVQRETIASMKPFRGPSIDLTDCANEAIQHVRGRSFAEAVRALVTVGVPPTVASLRKRAREARDQYPLSFIIPRRHMDRDGRTVATTIGTTGEPADDELEPAMFEHARVHQQVLVRGSINPARQQILTEHPGRRHEWVGFLRECPLVDPRRRQTVAIGLAAGLHGDLITSASVLAPQLEHLIRTLVASTGAVTSVFDTADGVQREAALGSMLRRPELAAMITENLVFDLRGLLDDPAGANIRNRVAHGLLDDDELMSGEALYLWFSTLRLVVLVSRVERPRGSVAADQDEEDEGT